MANYLYKTIITKDLKNVPSTNADQVDFETNFKSTAMAVLNIMLAETTFEILVDYATFKTKIDGVDVTWSLVKYTDNGNQYELNILSINPI